VNLASYLLLDCANQEYEEAVVISNDADLMVPVNLVASAFKKTVGVINPHAKKRRSATLAKVANWTYQTINRRYFTASQFPPTLSDAVGTITKPSSW